MSNITERDKKLLIFLAVFLLIVGLGAGVIYPVMEKSQAISDQLAEAELEKLEREQKVTLLPALKQKKVKAQENLEEAQLAFYSIMPSKDIDKLLTEMALSYTLVVTNLDIAMPLQSEYASLVSYPVLLAQYAGLAGATDIAASSYPGVYSANVSMTMTGTRSHLQSMLDELTGMEPKLRVSAFGWQQNGNNSEDDTYTLTVTLNLYMYENAETYAAMQMLSDMAGEGETAKTAEPTADDLTDELE